MAGEGGQEQREQHRLAELHRYEVLDTQPEPAFDELVAAAAAIARTPYAAVSLMDEHRQWFKAAIGLTGSQTGREVAFCDLVVQDDAELIVGDTLTEPRLAENPDVVGGPRFRFYAGFPLRTPTGAVLGTLCVIDQKPGSLSDEQAGILRTLADQVMAQLQLRLELRQRDQLIAQRQEAFDQLTAQSEILEQAQQLAQVGSWSADLLTDRVVWSREAHRILGTDPQMLLDTTTFLTYIHPDDHALVQRTVGETFERGQSDAIEIRAIRADGQTRILRSRYQVDQDAHGRPVRLSGILLDITDARATQRDLVRARDLLERVVSTSTKTGVIATGPDGLITLFNRGAELIFGYSAEEMIGTTGYEQFWDPKEIMDRAVQYGLQDDRGHIAVRATELGEDEWTYIHQDGSRRIGQLSASHMLDEHGERAGSIGFMIDVTEARRAQQEVAEAKELFEQLLYSATEQAIIATDLNGTITIFNRGAERILGFTAAELIGAGPPYPCFAPELAAAAADVINRIRQGASEVRRDSVWLRRDGVPLTMQLVVTPMRRHDGELVGVVVVATDVTEQRHAEAALVAASAEAEERRAQLEEAQRLAAVGSWTFDLRTGDVHWSPELFRMTGLDPASELDQNSFQQVIHPDDLDRFEAISRAGDAEDTYAIEHRMVRPDARELVVLAQGRAERDENGQVIKLHGAIQDITDVRRIERELIEAQAMFNQVIDASTEQAIFVVDAITGQIQLFNSGAERMLGYSAQEAVGSTLFRQFHDPAEVRAKSTWHGLDPDQYNGVEVFLRATQAGDREWSFIRKDGSRRIVLLTVNEMLDPQGEVTGWLSVGTDITQARRAEQEVQAALLAISQARDEAMAANQAKSAFLATMSHEIRTPMNAVIGMTGLLLDSQLDAEQRELLETVRGSGDQLLAIINDILDFSKIEAGDLDLEHRSFDLRDLVEGTVAQFAGSAKGLDLISHVDDGCPESVTGDVTRLRQVLSNLIGNAIKFTSEGDILVRVECEPVSQDQLRLLVSVRDTGIGIPEESMDRLFKSFSQVDASTTRNYGGTGLGLAISKALVNAMGGEISVQSVIGSGSTFSFTVLVGPDDSALPPRTDRMDAQTRRATLAGRRVLIVDDNATNRQILTLQLGSQAMETVDAGTPVAALQMLADPAEHFDLAIVDLAMPVLDGIQLAEAIHRLPSRHDLPLLLLSSLGRRLGEDEHRFAAVLTKPVRSGALLESIAKALAPGRAPAATVPEPARFTDDAATSEPPTAPASPAPGEPTPAAAPTGPAEAEPGPGMRILLAEDNEVNQKVGRLMLAKLGYQIDIVANGEEALAAAREHHYGVVLMDMHMPVMDGLEATRRIRAELPEQRQPRIVALTASVTMEDREACTAAGMDSYLSKPVRPDELAAVIARATELRHD